MTRMCSRCGKYPAEQTHVCVFPSAGANVDPIDTSPRPVEKQPENRHMTREQMLALVAEFRAWADQKVAPGAPVLGVMDYALDLARAVEVLLKALERCDDGDCVRTRTEPQQCPEPKMSCIDCYIAQAAAEAGEGSGG